MKFNKNLLIIMMVFISFLAVGAVSASNDVTDNAIDDVQTIDSNILLTENNDLSADLISNADKNNVLTDDAVAEDNGDASLSISNDGNKDENSAKQDSNLRDGENTSTTTKNITIYSNGELVNTFNFTTDSGNNFTFGDIIQMLNESGGMNMSSIEDFGKMFNGFNFTDGSNKDVNFSVSGDVKGVKYNLKLVSNENTYIFDYKVVSPKTTNSTPVDSKTLSIFADGEFLSNLSFDTGGFDFSQMMSVFANSNFDMSSLGQFAESFKNISASGSNDSSSNKTFFFKIDGLVGDIKYDMLVTSNATNFVFDYAIKYPKVETVLIVKDLTTTAFNSKIDGRIGKYFVASLTDSDGNALANKNVKIGFNGKVYDRVTNENGSFKLQVNLITAGAYTFAVCFLGDNDFNSSFAVAKITVNKQKASLTTKSATYNPSAKTKSLSATFKTANGNAIAGKKISFTVNGKTYTGTTDSKGVATVKVSISKKGTYAFTAKYAGDNTYAAISKSAKLILK